MNLRGFVRRAAAVVWGSAFPGVAMAGTSSMPWDGPIDSIKSSLQGPVAGAFVTIAIIATGLMWSFGEHGSSMRKVGGIAAGGSMALGTATAVSDITGQSTSSGAVLGQLHTLALLPAGVSLALFSVGMGFYVFASVRFFTDRARKPVANATAESGREAESVSV